MFKKKKKIKKPQKKSQKQKQNQKKGKMGPIINFKTQKNCF